MAFDTGFVFSRMPEMHFGAGKLVQLPALLRARGEQVLLITGAASFRRSAYFS